MRHVLFVCTHNAGRSQIAQAFFERYAPTDLRAESAGQAPADEIWPNVIEAMREVGIDISNRKPKKIDLQIIGSWQHRPGRDVDTPNFRICEPNSAPPSPATL
jgi:protein-tyrosine-phosphatase